MNILEGLCVPNTRSLVLVRTCLPSACLCFVELHRHAACFGKAKGDKFNQPHPPPVVCSLQADSAAQSTALLLQDDVARVVPRFRLLSSMRYAMLFRRSCSNTATRVCQALMFSSQSIASWLQSALSFCPGAAALPRGASANQRATDLCRRDSCLSQR